MKKNILIALYFVIGAVFATYPLVLHLTSSLPHTGDELLVTWILRWDIYSFFHNPLGIFTTNIFYPYHNTLAYSETFITAAIIGIIPWIVFQQPAAVYNVCLLFAISSTGFSTYLFVRYLTKSFPAGVISGTLVAFSSYTINKTMHIQLIGIPWIPLSLLFFYKYADTKKTKDIIFCCLFIFLQVLNSLQPAYFLAYSLVFLWIGFYFSHKQRFFAFLNRRVVFVVLATLVCITPIALPYFHVSNQFHYVRDIRDTIHFANRPEYTFFPTTTRLNDLLIAVFYKKDVGPYVYQGYIGGMFFLLFFFAGGYYVLKRNNIPQFLPFFLLGISAFIISMGPVFQWGGKVIKHPFLIPLPYALLYYLIPGFKGMRNSSRWEMLFVFAISVAIGILFAYLFKKVFKKRQIAITVGICFLVFVEIPLPMHIEKVPMKQEIPQTYYYINTLPKNTVVIEMPIYVWYMAPFATQELFRQYYSTVEFRNRINGGSGFDPPLWEKQAKQLLITFPDEASIQLLSHMQVKYVIVHAKEYDQLVVANFHVEKNQRFLPSQVILYKLAINKRLQFVKRIGEDYIYLIKR